MSIILRQLNSVGWNKVLALVLLVWIIILFSVIPLLTTHISNGTDKKVVEERLAEAISDLDSSKKQNLELQNILRDINISDLKSDQKKALENFQYRLTKAEHLVYSQDDGFVSQKEEPNSQYEILRRRTTTNVQELWYFISSELQKINKQANELAPELTHSISHMLNLGPQQKRSLLHDLDLSTSFFSNFIEKF